jgi:hypothetical protein
VRVLGVTLRDFKVTPSAPWTAGQTVELQVQSVEDSTPRVGKTIRFIFFDLDTGYTKSVDATTGSDGYAKTSFTIPFKIDTSVIPCGLVRFRAYDIEANVQTDPIDGKVAYPTRITISAPDQVNAGQSFTISGKLEFQDVDGAWKGLANRTVALYYNGTSLGTATTGSDGSYSKSVSIPTSGTYTLKAVYAGEGFGLAPAESILGITVGVPEFLWTAGALALAAAPLIAVGGILAYSELSKRR